MRKIALAIAVALAAAAAFGQPSDEAARKKLLEIAFKYRGVPYVYGSESPKAFDCSGFVRYVYREAFGLELPRSARGFYSAGSPIDWRAARPGDVFVYDTVGGAPSHVSIVVGDGTVIHAVSDGPRTGVIVSPMTDRYWTPRLIAARTFLSASDADPRGEGRSRRGRRVRAPSV
jgi:cell wall-associated NlpC family hydrolase